MNQFSIQLLESQFHSNSFLFVVQLPSSANNRRFDKRFVVH
ncbi:hypothetical protein [Holdemania massiliensis]|nr:hypothetical protein [Holdemania massiliensis]